MAYYLSPVFQDAQFISSTADFAVGYKLYTYLAGTTTPVATYQDNAGSASHANPIVLNARGEPSAPIWLASGAAVKFVLKTDADVTVRTIDNVYGIGDTAVASTGSSTQEWEAFSATPTYVSSTSFTVTGNQTSTLHVGRRLKIAVSGGTSYSTIVSSAYTSLTTVTIDTTGSSGLDSSINALTSFSVGLLRADNPAVPLVIDSYPIRSGSSDKTKKWAAELDGLTTATTRTWTIPDRNAFPVIGEDFTLLHNAALAVSISVGAFTIALKTLAGADPSTSDPVYVGFRSATATTGTPVVRKITSALSMSLGASSNLGSRTNFYERIWVGLIDNSGTPELCCYLSHASNSSTGLITGILRLNENDIVTTTAESGTATSAMTLYSTSARSSKAFRHLGYFVARWNGSTWDAHTKVQTTTADDRRPGEVVQVQRTDTGAYVSGTTVIPSDDTVPTSSEGFTITSVGITSRDTCNAYRVEGGGTFSVSGAGEYISVYIAEDSNAAQRANQSSQNSADPQYIWVGATFGLTQASGTASTWYLRAGPTNGANTVAANGYSGARKLGGVMNTYIQVEEVFL